MAIKLEINGNECEVRFRHTTAGDQDVTHCFFLREDIAIGRGLAVRHPNDRPNRIVGRKVALADALRSQPKENRRLVWEAFFAASPRHKRG